MRSLLIAVALLCAAAAPARAEDTTIKAWVGRCDDGACRASLPSGSGAEALMIGRLAKGDAFLIGFATPFTIADADRSVLIRADGKQVAIVPARGYDAFERVDAFWLTDARAANAVLQAALKAKALRLEYLDVTGSPHDGDFALDGLADMLAWFEARQPASARRREAGSAAKALEPAPAATKAELIAKQGVPPRLLERHRAASDCEDPGSALLKPIPPVIGALSANAFLYAIPCTASKGNVSYRIWVVESGEIGGITPYYFAGFDDTFGWKGTDLLYNVGFNDADGRLTSTFKGRAEGDCGSRGVWHWKVTGFVLDEYRVASDCSQSRQPADWPRVWPKN